VLDLFYAHSLVSYTQIYSWEIRGRERVVSDDEVDLKRWTLEQIVAEANRAYSRVWAERAKWGESSIGELARYIDQNDYPARIRGTLRDAVSYLWVELLADSSLWRPGQANQLYQLDVPALIAGDPARSAALDLAEPRVHPLSKIGAVLDDLEVWHGSAGRPEAALEARLERLRRLNAAFASVHDQRAVREHCKVHPFDRSPTGGRWAKRRSPRCCRGRRGGLLVAAPEPGGASATRTASAGMCRHLVATIETVVQRRGHGARRREPALDRVTATWPRSASGPTPSTSRRSPAPGLQPAPRLPRFAVARRPRAGRCWTVSTGDPTTATMRLRVAADATGRLRGRSARRDFAREANQMSAFNLVIGDLVLLSSQAGGGWEVSARSGGSGLPFADAEVSLYRADWRRGHRLVDQKRTGIDGLARFTSFGQRPDQYFLLARWQDHVAVDLSFLYGYDEPSLGVDSGAFLYTDRSVYRPQQTIHWKVVAYRGGGDEQRHAPTGSG
jgi:hypothetical protein